jgi:hypothetical protein
MGQVFFLGVCSLQFYVPFEGVDNRNHGFTEPQASKIDGP